MAAEATIYRSAAGEAEVLALYDWFLSRLDIPYESRTLETRFGTTHLLVAGSEGAQPLMVFHGGNVVNPLTLKWFEPLAREFRIYAPDTIGHPGRSAQRRVSPRDSSYGEWVVDLLDGLGLERVPSVGPSYGAGIILRTAAYAPERVSRAVLLIPSGIANGSLWGMVSEMLVPMLLYRLTGRESLLVRAVRPMFTEEPEDDVVELCGAVFRNVKLERQMPKDTSREELEEFLAPTLLLAAENDIFFPARRVIPQAREVIPNLVAAETLPGSGHFPSREGLKFINRCILEFLQDRR